jgi:enoyl-CoA hydratase
MTDDVLIERRDDVLAITLNRPENGNLVNNDIGEKIISALDDISSGVKLVRLQGNGADFCRGRESPAIDRVNARAREFRDKIADPALALYAAFMNCRAPVLGVVKGRAAGVGCTLAAICDLSVASDDAVLQIPEMNHSIPPTLVMSAMVGRVPVNAIAHLVLTREPIAAERARALGIVSEVVPAADVDRRADQIEARLLECSPQSLQAVKEFLRASPSMDQAGRIAFAANLIATVLSSPARL